MKTPARMFGEVMRHILKPPATCGYPFAKAKITERFRGRVDFDSAKCIGCQMCVRVCPAKAIEIPLSKDQPAAPAPVEGQPAAPAKKKFDCLMDLGHCVYCWQCVDTCPKQALIATQDFELAHTDRESLKRHYK